MKPKSSPSPDSLQACIYQLDPESFATFLLPTFQEILTSHTQIEEFAKSITTLVPKKVKIITCFDQIRPISLCNVDYKIFSSVLSNRLKKIPDEVTSPTQTQTP
eukprot:TRINITY_DN504_c0_g1_i11.p2 TRINITY_DN504_c0_g1~~TRINITY_DN504_c0_g1_i11.p2  ORF type:complete len:104 (+),score=16.77 TRINITY_DN504_c0_g1_i11:779-1090(+)